VTGGADDRRASLPAMSIDALTSAEISLPATPDATRVRERIAILARHVDLVGLTDNHAGKPRMSPLAAVALAREQGVATVVHVSCRDRNRLALRSQVIGAAALGSEGVLCLYGDPVPGVPRVRDYTTTRLLAEAKAWAAPHDLALGCVADPFAVDGEAELALLGRKVAAGADFVQTQIAYDADAMGEWAEAVRSRGIFERMFVLVGVAPPRSARSLRYMRDHLPGVVVPDEVVPRVEQADDPAAEGVRLTVEVVKRLREIPGVAGVHVIGLGREVPVRRVIAGAGLLPRPPRPLNLT